MDAWDAPAAFVAAALLVLAIGLSRRLDREISTYGKNKISTNLVFFGLLGAGAYGYFFNSEHPFWGDVLVSVMGGLAGIGVISLAGTGWRRLSEWWQQ